MKFNGTRLRPLRTRWNRARHVRRFERIRYRRTRTLLRRVLDGGTS